jgi:hypothetical protein
MDGDFFRFPHTPHLAWLGQAPPRDDKVLSAAEAKSLLAGEVAVDEKLARMWVYRLHQMAACARKTVVST